MSRGLVELEFQGFLRATFPDGPPQPGSEHFNQLRLAFYAGALASRDIPTGVFYTEAQAFLYELKAAARQGLVH